MNIYVYQIGDKDYRAELCPEFYGKEGRVVEVWPVNNDKEIKFVTRHGSAFHGVSDAVTKLADQAKKALQTNGTYTKELQQDIFNQKELRERSERLDAREQHLTEFEERNTEQETKLKTGQDRLDSARENIDQHIEFLRDRGKTVDQREDAIQGQEQLLDEHQTWMDQREFAVNQEEIKLIKRKADFLNERNKLLRFNERRTLDLDNRVKALNIREKKLADIENMSLFARFKTVFRRSK